MTPPMVRKHDHLVAIGRVVAGTHRPRRNLAPVAATIAAATIWTVASIATTGPLTGRVAGCVAGLALMAAGGIFLAYGWRQR